MPPEHVTSLVLRKLPPDQPGWWARHVPSRDSTMWLHVKRSGGDVRDTEPFVVWLPALEVYVSLSATCGPDVLWAGPALLLVESREIGEGP